MSKFNYNIVKFSIITTLLVFVLYEISANTKVVAQTGRDISISLANSSFVPLNSSVNQLKVSVKYDIENPLQDSKINGVMKVYASNGTLVKYSSFPNGFLANQTGIVDFKTVFKDPRLNNIIANITLLDSGKKNALSNTITSRLNLQEPGNGSNPYELK